MGKISLSIHTEVNCDEKGDLVDEEVQSDFASAYDAGDAAIFPSRQLQLACPPALLRHQTYLLQSKW